MRVALVRQRYNPYGGAERFIERALPALERAGVELTLISRRAEGWGARRFLAVDPFHVGNAWRDASFAAAARTAWEAGGFDLVQSHERIAGCDIYRAGDGVHAEWLDIRRAAAGTMERLGIALNPYHRYVCAAERRLFTHPRLRAVVCNSAMVRGEIERRFGVAPQKLHVIHNGVDLEHFHPARRAELRSAARTQLGLGERAFLFLFVGSGFWRKGLDAAIGALALVDDPLAARELLAHHPRGELRNRLAGQRSEQADSLELRDRGGDVTWAHGRTVVDGAGRLEPRTHSEPAREPARCSGGLTCRSYAAVRPSVRSIAPLG